MKKLLLSVVLGFTLFPISVMAQQVPAEIQEAAEKSLLDKAIKVSPPDPSFPLA